MSRVDISERSFGVVSQTSHDTFQITIGCDYYPNADLNPISDLLHDAC